MQRLEIRTESLKKMNQFQHIFWTYSKEKVNFFHM